MDPEQYYQLAGTDHAEFEERVSPDAEDTVKKELVLDAVATALAFGPLILLGSAVLTPPPAGDFASTWGVSDCPGSASGAIAVRLSGSTPNFESSITAGAAPANRPIVFAFSSTATGYIGCSGKLVINVPYARRAFAMSRSLVSQGLTSKLEHLERLRLVRRLEGELSVLHESVPQAEAALKEVRRRLVQLRQCWQPWHLAWWNEMVPVKASDRRNPRAARDAFRARRLLDSPATMFAMLREGLVDTISTDYAGGYHDPMLLGISEAVQAGVTTLPAAVAMASANVADALPAVAPNRGRIAAGAVGDLVVADPRHLDDVRWVLIDGHPVVAGGELAYHPG